MYNTNTFGELCRGRNCSRQEQNILARWVIIHLKPTEMTEDTLLLSSEKDKSKIVNGFETQTSFFYKVETNRQPTRTFLHLGINYLDNKSYVGIVLE
jgi:hypothetical protein